MASAVRDIVSDAIRNRVNDPRISTMTSVTRVEMSGDLLIAKVFVSVMGSETERRRSLAGLQHAKGHIQRIVAHELNVRHCPEIRLELDEMLRKTAETLKIIEETMRETERSQGEIAAAGASPRGTDDSVE